MELFAYVLMALGILYVVMFSVIGYLGFRYNLPLLGMARPPKIPEPPRWQ